MASSCDRCRRLGFPSELNRYPDGESRKRHGLLHLEVDLGVGAGAAQELLDKMEEDCFSSENQQEISQTSEKISCPKCWFSARTEKQLIRHLRHVHVLSWKTSCDICGQKNQSSDDLTRHLMSRINQRHHKCDRDFNREFDLKRHQNAVHSEKAKETIKNRKKLMFSKKVAKNVSCQQEMSCATCGKDFQARRSLQQHRKWFHARPTECELCGLRFHTQKALNDHRKNKHPDGHKTEQPYELVVLGSGREAWRCLRCGFLDVSAALADAHQLKHSADPRKCQGEPDDGTKSQMGFLFHCIKCDFSAQSERHLITHLRLVHLKGTQTKCHLCEKKCTNPAYLADHLLFHMSYHPFKCACGLTFKRNSNFKTHLLSCAETSTEESCINNSPFQTKRSLKRRLGSEEVGISQKKLASDKSGLPRFGAFAGLYEAESGWRCKSCNMHFKSRSADFYSHLRSHQSHPEVQRRRHSKMSSHQEKTSRRRKL